MARVGDAVAHDSSSSAIMSLTTRYRLTVAGKAWLAEGNLVGTDAQAEPETMGHQAKLTELHVIHLCEGLRAAVFETAFIKWAKRRFPRECANVPSDSRGLGKALPHFLYIATK